MTPSYPRLPGALRALALASVATALVACPNPASHNKAAPFALGSAQTLDPNADVPPLTVPSGYTVHFPDETGTAVVVASPSVAATSTSVPVTAVASPASAPADPGIVPSAVPTPPPLGPFQIPSPTHPTPLPEPTYPTFPSPSPLF